jgi:choline dehydrogenase-like flavoprotein
VIVDAREINGGSVIDADVCIVGSGPAGLTLAREFKNQSLKICLIESGGFTARRALKRLNEGQTFGDPYPNPRWGRIRQFGGTPNRWQIEISPNLYGARYAPLSAIDFEARDWLPNSGWPLSKVELDPYYARAQQHCGIGPYAYDTESWQGLGLKPLKFATDRLETSMFQFGPKDVWTKHYDDVTTNAPNVTCVVNGTVLEVETDDGGTNVTGVRAVNAAGTQFQVRASHVILAVGCIESSRLLLLSRNKRGLGNQHDVVGRYFMDHPQSYLNVFTPTDRRIFDNTALYDLRPIGGYGVMAKLAFSEDTMRRQQLQNICFVLFPRRDHFMSEAFQSFFTLLLTVIHRQRPSNLPYHLKTMLRGSGHLLQIGTWALQGKAPYPYLARGGWSSLANRSDLFTVFEIFSLLEQAPDPNNRIMLGEQLDPNGQPKVQVHWRFTERDQQSVLRARALFQEEFTQDGLGAITYTKELYSSPSSVHPIGGTRMNNNPRFGVVDENCKVYEVSNLYIASSAVFPTSGYANPTLTVVALACRLADHIKQTYKQIPVIAEEAIYR